MFKNNLTMYISKETPYWKTRKRCNNGRINHFCKKTRCYFKEKVFPNLFLQVGLFTLEETFSSSEK